MLKLQNTKGFKIVTGVTPGYFHTNEVSKNIEQISEVWQNIATKYFKNGRDYISVVIQPSKTVYNGEWGCPKGGEDTFTITGEANLKFIEDLDKWVETVGMCAVELKHKLKQTTLTIEIFDEQLAYLTEEN